MKEPNKEKEVHSLWVRWGRLLGAHWHRPIGGSAQQTTLVYLSSVPHLPMSERGKTWSENLCPGWQLTVLWWLCFAFPLHVSGAKQANICSVHGCWSSQVLLGCAKPPRESAGPSGETSAFAEFVSLLSRPCSQRGTGEPLTQQTSGHLCIHVLDDFVFFLLMMWF